MHALWVGYQVHLVLHEPRYRPATHWGCLSVGPSLTVPLATTQMSGLGPWWAPPHTVGTIPSRLLAVVLCILSCSLRPKRGVQGGNVNMCHFYMAPHLREQLVD